VNYSDSTPDVTLEYDRLGRPTEVTDATGSREFAYEDGGDLGIDTETLDGLLDKTLDWDRDAQGRRSLFVPLARAIPRHVAFTPPQP